MKFKSRTFFLRRKHIIRFGVTVLTLALATKFFSHVNIEDGLSILANSLSVSEKIIETELSHTLYSPVSVPQLITAQSPALSAPSPQTESLSYTPWQLKIQNSNVSQIKPVSINPTSGKGYVTSGKVFLKNDSGKTINLSHYLNSDLPFKLSGDGVHVLIVHTHGSESYHPDGKDFYTPEDVERTTDTRYNVVRIGDEIESILKSKGISVIHDRNIYDRPTYNGSYTRALNAITNHLKKNPGIKVIIDVHRDSICADDGTRYKTVAKVNGKDSAQLMLVMSTGESGLPHPNWQENLKFGVKLQSKIANKYPGLMRPINLRKDRFNMHVTTGSILVEVGSAANTLEEALVAIRPFSEELAAILLSAKK